MKKIIIAFVPVLHEGYRRLLEKHADAHTLYIYGEQMTDMFEYLKKEIRALSPELIEKGIESWGTGISVEILDQEKLKSLSKTKAKVVMPDEDISRELKEKFFKKYNVTFDSIFLRWDKHNTIAEKPVNPDLVISKKKFDKDVMKKALAASEKSADFWRHIGAAIVKNGKIISVARNNHVPSDHMPYANGDPRNAFKRGVNIDISTVIHAEARLIAEAAEKGMSLKGASMYVTTFPCPTCAKLIAYSGIKTLYALGGYAVLDGESILKARGVEIVFVEVDEKVEAKKKWKGYKK